MEIINKPDLRVFASEAKSGEVAKFPDILRGWGITFEQTQGKPPLEWMNDAFNRIDLNNLYLLQQGVAEWQKEIRYPKNSIVKKDGKLYLCLIENENNEPSQYSDKWSLLIKKATTEQEGIVQLTNTIDTSQDKAITPFAVNELQKLLQEALRLAIPVGFIANWPGETAPNEDWLIMRGQKYDRAKYSELYDLLKTDTLPDGRGVMLRGLDSNRGFDPGRALLSYQEDAMQKIYGEVGSMVRANKGLGDMDFGAFYMHNIGVSFGIDAAENGFPSRGTTLDSSLVTRTNTQNETISKNIALNIIIKVK